MQVILFSKKDGYQIIIVNEKEHSFVHNLLALNIAGHMNTELIQQHGTTRKFCLHESS